MSHTIAGARLLRLGLPFLLLALIPSCATIQSVLALSQVNFSLDRVHQVEVAGVEMDRVRSYDDLALADVLRVGSAVSQGAVPLDLTLELTGRNPDDNPEAHLVALDWTLFLQDRETVRGVTEQEVRFAPGESTGFPVQISLDLVEFFGSNARDLLELALALAQPDAGPAGLRLEVIPTVETRLGPIRYPQPLILER